MLNNNNNSNYGNYENDSDNDDKQNNVRRNKINKIFVLFITFFAMYLAYDCNKCESMGMRILYTLLAGLFSGIYLLYYLVVRVFLGNKCKKGLDDMTYSATSHHSYELFKRR